MARLTSFLLSCLVLGVVLSPPPATGATVGEAISSGDFDRAKTLLNQVERPAERLFLRGLIAFRKGNHARARTHFKKLIRNHPEHPRSEDASYYLDRIKLYSPSAQAPMVRVQLDQTGRAEGSASGPTLARRSSGETITVVQADQSWSLHRGYLGGLELTVANESHSLEGGEGVVFEPLGSGAHVAYDNSRYRGTIKVLPEGETFNVVNVLPLDQYLFGVVRKEIAPGWPIETVKAQSVAARSFALSKIDEDTGVFDLKSSHLAQVYGGMEAETKRVRKAVRATRGEVLTYSDRVVPAYFHANSGGHIETAASVWNGSRTPYIVPKPDTWSRNTRHYRWEASVSVEQLNRSLSKHDYPRLSQSPDVRVESRLESGRSRSISYRTRYDSRRTLPASDFRMAVGPNRLKSSWFESIRRNGSTLHFEGRGWGHGIGMSQWGAHRMGEKGLSYRKILNFYYERAKLMGQYGLGTRPEGDIDG